MSEIRELLGAAPAAGSGLEELLGTGHPTPGEGAANRLDKIRLAAALAQQLQRRQGQISTRAGEAIDEAPLGLLAWTMRHRQFLIPDRPLDFVKHPYLVALYGDTSEHMTVRKAAQMGASELLISYAMHACDVRKATVLYVFPTDTHVSDFSVARIGPAIEASPYLQRLIVSGGDQTSSEAARRKAADRVTLKRVGDRFWYLRGARVKKDGGAPQLKSVDADVVLLDEVDEMDQRAIPIAEKRLGADSLGEMRAVSTPTYPGMGIEQLWVLTNQMYWFIRCDHCGKRQYLTLDHFVVEYDALERPIIWNGMDEDKAVAHCQKCDGVMDRLGPGEWIAEFPHIKRHGYHLTKLYSARQDPLEIIERLRVINETQRKECVNQDLGLPYQPRGGRMTNQLLDLLRRDYAFGVMPTEETTMGVDVGNVLHFVVRGPKDYLTGEKPLRMAGVVDSFEAIAAEIIRWNCKRVVVDAMPETKKARELQAKFEPGLVWLAYYSSSPASSRRPDMYLWRPEQGEINIDRTRGLDRMYEGFYTKSHTLPAHMRDVPGYYDQICHMVRVVEERQHTQLAVYVGTAADHYAHAEGYQRAAEEAPRVARISSQAVPRWQMEAMMR